jgi:hypothetical protein
MTGMGKWIVGDEAEPALVVRSETGEDAISLHIPSPDPVLFTVPQIEQLRRHLGAAIAIARTQS